MPFHVLRLICFAIFCVYCPELTPGEMERIIESHPKNLRELELQLGLPAQYLAPESPNSPKWDLRIKRMQEQAVSRGVRNKIEKLDVNWYPGVAPREYQYVLIKEALTPWQAANHYSIISTEATMYYFLLDEKLNILGWVKDAD